MMYRPRSVVLVVLVVCSLQGTRAIMAKGGGSNEAAVLQDKHGAIAASNQHDIVLQQEKAAVKRSSYEFEGNSVHNYNTPRARVHTNNKAQQRQQQQQQQAGSQHRLDAQSTEPRGNFFNQEAPPPTSYGGYGSASGPGPSYGVPFSGSNDIAPGSGGPQFGGGSVYGGSAYGGGGNHIDSSPGDQHYQHYEHHPKKQGHHHKSLAIKALLVPLVGVALLGVATAFVSNPILLQLGVITGKRRRRELSQSEASQELQRKLEEMEALERYISELPKEEAATQEKMLLANYLTCSGITSTNHTSVANCLERLTCELHHPESSATNLEKHVMGIVTSEILTNEFIPSEVKHRVKLATSRGADAGDCAEFPCFELESHE